MPKPSQQVKQVWQRKQSHFDFETIQKSKKKEVWKMKLKAQEQLKDSVNTAQGKQKSIKQRALHLQIKLFGLTSVLLWSKDWLSFVRCNQGYKSLPENPCFKSSSKPSGYLASTGK